MKVSSTLLHCTILAPTRRQRRATEYMVIFVTPFITHSFCVGGSCCYCFYSPAIIISFSIANHLYRIMPLLKGSNGSEQFFIQMKSRRANANSPLTRYTYTNQRNNKLCNLILSCIVKAPLPSACMNDGQRYNSIPIKTCPCDVLSSIH